MPRIKSFVSRISVDVAQRSHNCQHASSHRINQGDKRLKLKVGRTFEYFCVKCALQSIDADISKLQKIRDELSNS
jgi:hypothetical protein